jgi:carbamoyl-phosphate synthase small subunit
VYGCKRWWGTQCVDVGNLMLQARRLFATKAAKGAGASATKTTAFKAKSAVLVMENGTKFEGVSIGADKSSCGEVVFNTGMMVCLEASLPGAEAWCDLVVAALLIVVSSVCVCVCVCVCVICSRVVWSHAFVASDVCCLAMVISLSQGYPDSLTDPSYRGQMLLCTYPIVGNYGVPSMEKDGWGLAKNLESNRIQAKGLIVADYCHEYSHWRAHQSLSDWLKEFNVPGISGVDTRLLTKMIRDAGEMKGKIIVNNQDVSWEVPELKHPVSEVSCKEPFTVGKGDIKIVAIDTGMKDSMLRCLVSRGATVKVVPYNWDISKEQYDGLFLSNGPGDPVRCTETLNSIRHALAQEKPIFGICLGTQLMALAAGAKTYKLPFGHRGQNQPCINVLDERCYITSQNHSYAIDSSSLPEGWTPLFLNANDGSVEGIYHKTKPFFSVQFHPEARCGPEDTHFLFDKFLDTARRHKAKVKFDPKAGLYPFIKDDSVGLRLGQGESIRDVIDFTKVYREPLPKKVLVLGSGGLQIGQAGEFDYSGSQCLKALKEEGIKTILMNPNIATVQTAEGLADEVYFLPVTPEFVEAVIRKERPDAIMLQFGGQTALNCGIELQRQGILTRNGVRVCGTSVDSIIKTEDREMFNQALTEINEKFCTSIAVDQVEDAIVAANKIGYPIIARCGFALGGLGSGFADNDTELRELAQKALAVTPQILVEKSIKGWKELEYEVVRDASDNCVTVCNMENFDPLGIHTGTVIVRILFLGLL